MCNIVRWLPILWDDVDWDFTSLYVVMYTKLRFMRDHHEEHHHHTDWQADVMHMKIAEDCLRRLQKDNYLENEWNNYHKKFPRDGRWIDLPDGMKQMPPMSDKQHSEFLKICESEEAAKQSDLQDFASTFVNHVREWWD